MNHEGPALEELLRHLAETPEDFLAEPRVGALGQVDVPAVAMDVFSRMGLTVSTDALTFLEGKHADKDRPRLKLILLALRVLAHPFFEKPKAPVSPGPILELLDSTLAALAKQNPQSKKFLTDPERREELARLVLAGAGFRPMGETLSVAQDRLIAISSSERARVVAAAKAAEERARKIREELARKAAEESADKYTRE